MTQNLPYVQPSNLCLLEVNWIALAGTHDFCELHEIPAHTAKREGHLIRKWKRQLVFENGTTFGLLLLVFVVGRTLTMGGINVVSSEH